jgi:hypothetical protein
LLSDGRRQAVAAAPAQSKTQHSND